MWRASADAVNRAHQLLEGYLDEKQVFTTEKVVTSNATGLDRLQLLAGISTAERRAICRRVVFYILIGLVISVSIGSIFPVVLGAVLVGIEYVRTRRLIHRRAESFERDYTALLLSLASAIRTGMDPLSALLALPALFAPDSEVVKEILSLRERIDSGMSEEGAIREFGLSIAHPDIKLFTTAFILARREGSSLAECLQRLARVTRQRQSFRRKIRSAVAMQKLSAFGIALCTVAIAIVQAVSNPQAIQAALVHPVGVKLLYFGGALILFGLGWMMKMTSAKI